MHRTPSKSRFRGSASMLTVRAATAPRGASGGGIEAQTHQVFANLRRVLLGIGLDLQHVVQARVFLRHFDDDYAAMNAVYQTYFAPGRRPARTCVGVTGLARGARVEIDFVARRPG